MRRARGRPWVNWVLGTTPRPSRRCGRCCPGRRAGNRDFAQGARTRVDSYRGRKDSAVALYYLWRVGEAMVVRRTPTFERVYAPAHAVAPERHLRDVARRRPTTSCSTRRSGRPAFSKLNGVNNVLHREELTRKDVEPGGIASSPQGGHRGRGRGPAPAVTSWWPRIVPILETLAAGRVPRGWKPPARRRPTR